MKTNLKLSSALFFLAFSSSLLAAPSTLTIETPKGPGAKWLRAAEDAVKRVTTVKLDIQTTKAKWMVETPLDATAKPTIVSRPLTAKEKAAGWAEKPVGYWGALLLANAEAPIDDVDLKKWNAYRALKKEGKTRWSTIGNPPAGKDAALTWALPGATFGVFARPLVYAGALPERLLTQLRKEDVPLFDAGYEVGQKKDTLAVAGLDFRRGPYWNPLAGVKILKVNGIEPTATAIQNGTYAFSKPLMFVYKQADAADPESALGKFVRFLDTPEMAKIAEMRTLVPPRLPGEKSS